MADGSIILHREAGEGDRDGEAGVVEGAHQPTRVTGASGSAALRPLRLPASPPATSAAERVRSVKVVTFGCRLNAYESDAIAAQAAADGVANTVVFNTCAVTGEAVRQARQQIRKVRRERPDARLVVTGCAAQVQPAAFAAMPEVDLVLGNAEKAAPGALLKAGMQVGDIFEARLPSPTPERSPRGAGERARAYVEVQNGCDHRCTFCIIPFGRGNARSVRAEQVIDEVRDLARAG